MLYAILLDAYQDQVEPDQYAVTYSGTLEECEAQTHHNGRFKTWSRADFEEVSSRPVQLEAETGDIDRGQIVGMEEKLLFARASAMRMGLSVAVGAAAGVIAGFAIARGMRRSDK